VPLLLDTHAFLWWVDDSPRLSARARRAIGKPAEPCYFSLASCWEICIKVSLGRLRLPESVDRFLAVHMAANGIQPLGLHLPHVSRVATLPFHHRDPFDRLLAAQALVEGLTVVSADAVFKKYGVDRIW
jgi:PIN domain nuclease of toxin-antitoxin system